MSILICIWFSAPLGIVLAEIIRRRLDRRVAKTAQADYRLVQPPLTGNT